MRDKTYQGWAKYNFLLKYENGGNVILKHSCHRNNDYMNAFLKNMILRPSCHNCQSRDFRSSSDITLGDYWRIQAVNFNMYDNKGTSLVLIHNEKAFSALDWHNVKFIETSIEDGLKGNSVVYDNPSPWFRRQLFFDSLSYDVRITYLIRKLLRPTFLMAIKSVIPFIVGKFRGMCLRIKTKFNKSI